MSLGDRYIPSTDLSMSFATPQAKQAAENCEDRYPGNFPSLLDFST